MNTVKDDLKNKTFKNIYLFYGEEDYLKKYYLNALVDELIPKSAEIMNYDVFEGKTCNVDLIEDAFNTLPFMNEYRVIVIKQSNLFYMGRKDDSEKILSGLEHLPDTSIIIFLENLIDKRSRLFKKVNSLGHVAEFKTPKEKELVIWVKNLFNKNNIKISNNTAEYLLHTVAHNMDSIVQETSKLIDYKKSSGEISFKDIDDICIKSLEVRVFDLVASVANKKTENALSIYNSLILLKEEPIMILNMLARQFRLILQTIKLRQLGSDNKEITQILGIREFALKEYLLQARNFSEQKLIDALKDCLETDINIKTGVMDGKLSVELLIIKYSCDN